MKCFWIWNYGDYAIYHSNLVSSRRQEYGADYPTFWRIPNVEKKVNFYKSLDCDCEGYIKLILNGKGYLMIDGKRYKSNEKIKVLSGHHELEISVVNLTGLPCAYIEGEACPTDASWYTMDSKKNKTNVGCDERYNNPNITPETFLFEYKRLKPVFTQEYDNGRLFDFGKEVFGYLYVSANTEDEIYVSYGESKEEALDAGESILSETISGKKSYKLTQRAFRYIFVSPGKNTDVEMDFEYIPFEYKGSFMCNNEAINKIWDMCTYTFHLNCREVLLDGIKRDRWCWSGDAYQCYKFNNYLFFDKDIVKRTIIALRGNEPVTEHINTITDYSFYWIISIYDYYMAFADKEFVSFIYDKAVTLMRFASERVNKDGFITAKDNDWIFIDWTEMDKTGAVCAEQMLYIAANNAMAKLARVLNMPYDEYENRAKTLTDKLNKFYWDEDFGAFIDSYESGKRHVTRHANIFALLYNIATEQQRDKIVKNVIFNDAVTKITTPYFEGFELDVMGLLGRYDYIEGMLDSYWNEMLKLGATTVWEEFNPELSGTEHYKMYTNKYGKSLCHAWGASPIYLLGRYYLGVYPTSPGYETFEVRPSLGGFKNIKGSVPINGGIVSVDFSEGRLSVASTKAGGTLILDNKSYELIPDKELIIG